MIGEPYDLPGTSPWLPPQLRACPPSGTITPDPRTSRPTGQQDRVDVYRKRPSTRAHVLRAGRRDEGPRAASTTRAGYRRRPNGLSTCPGTIRSVPRGGGGAASRRLLLFLVRPWPHLRAERRSPTCSIDRSIGGYAGSIGTNITCWITSTIRCSFACRTAGRPPKPLRGHLQLSLHPTVPRRPPPKRIVDYAASPGGGSWCAGSPSADAWPARGRGRRRPRPASKSAPPPPISGGASAGAQSESGSLRR